MKLFMLGFSFVVALSLVLFQSLDKDVNVTPEFPYDLNSPDEVIKLDKDLREISGLSYINDSTIAAVQDEKGSIFLINSRTGKKIQRIKFAKDGDYEGLALAGKIMFVVRSDGDIYKVKRWRSDNVKTKKFETDLNTSNDVEGLCYLHDKGILLLACKNRAGIDKKMKNKRAVYAFDVRKNKLSEEPFLEIDLKEMKHIISKSLDDEYKKNIMPSGIVSMPGSGDIYILSSVGEVLLIFDKAGNFKNVSGLPDKYFLQPEGICFDKQGNLYIANEGQDKKARLLKFTPKEIE